MSDRVGQQLGNYRLTRLLGRGGFAEVYLGEHIYLESPAAIKVLRVILSDEHRANFLAEAQHLVRLKHPHIVRVLEFGIEEEVPFLVMEYAPNGSLRTKHPRGSQVPLETVVSYVKQVADALYYIHGQKLIHRDIKPENLLLGPDQEVLLGDLGIVVLAHTTGSLIVQGQAGTPPYMAPEQIRGIPREVSDQYALGIVVYEWLCGAYPFQGSVWSIMDQHLHAEPLALHEHLPTVSSGVEAVVLKALTKDPKQRFESAQAFAAALEQACRMSKPLDLSPSPSQPSPPDHSFSLLAAQPILFPEPPLSSSERIPELHQSWQHVAMPLQSHAPSPPLHEKSNTKRDLTPLSKRDKPQKPHRIPKRRVIIFAGSVLLVLTTIVGLLFPSLIQLISRGSSHSPHTGIARLSISPNNATLKQKVLLDISGFSPSTKILLTRDAQEPIQVTTGSSLVKAGATGDASVSFLVDGSWSPGFHLIESEDVTTRYTASATLQIIGAGPTGPSRLLIGTPVLDMGAALEGVNTIKSLVLHNSGGGSISWAASSNQPFLLLSPTKGTFSTSQTISVAVERDYLKAGDYKGFITFSSNVVAPQIVPVRMSVQPLPDNVGAALMVTPVVLSYTATDDGADSTPQFLMVTNPGSQRLNWSLSAPNLADWLSVDRNSGVVVPHSSMAIHIYGHSQNLLPGVYIATLIFTSSGVLNNPQNVSVSLTIQPRCGLSISMGSLSFTAVSSLSNPGNQTVDVSSTSGCTDTINWRATASSSWLIVAPAMGQLNNTMATTSIGVNGSSLAPGTYTGAIDFVTGRSTQTVTVQLTVQAPSSPSAPLLEVSPLNLNLSSTQGERSPPGQIVTITNTGGSQLYWHAQLNTLTSSSSWLGVGPIGGSIPAGQTGQMAVYFNTTNLTPDTYVGQVTLISSDVQGNVTEGSPQTITINLLVQAPCTLTQSSSSLYFTTFLGNSDLSPQLVTYTSFGKCGWPLNWKANITSSVHWLKIAPSAGLLQSNGQSVSVSVNASIAGLPPGTYTGTIAFIATGNGGAVVQRISQTVSVLLDVIPS